MRKQLIKRTLLYIVTVTLFVTSSLPLPAYAAKDIPLLQKTAGENIGEVEYKTYDILKYSEYEKQFAGKYTSGEFSEEISPDKSVSSNRETEISTVEGKQAVLQNSECGDLSWNFNIYEAGLYCISVEYFIDSQKASTVKRNLLVDGSVPFEEALGILFLQHFYEDNLKKHTEYGDQLRGSNMPYREWEIAELTDSSGICNQAFCIFFTKGIHNVTLAYSENDLWIGNFKVYSYREIMAYKDVKASYSLKDERPTDEIITFEAEETVAFTDDVTIRRENSSDVTVTPSSSSKKLLNIYGGSRWDTGNRTISWRISVPKDGLYKIVVHCCQNFSDGLPVYRQIRVDGQIPFEEMTSYRFPYSSSYNNVTLADEEGEPYLFEISAGEHLLSMTVKLGKTTQVIESIENAMKQLSDIQLSISKLTGNKIDPNYDYEFFKKIDGLEDNMKALSSDLADTTAVLKEISGRTPSVASSLKNIQTQIDAMIKNPFSIAKNYADLENAQTTLGTWYLSLKSSAMAVDSFYIAAKDTKVKQTRHSIWKMIFVNIRSLINSFARSYTEISGYVESDVEITDSISVWVARGSEWAEAIKQLADSQFTPATGIAVKLNTVPASQLNSGSANVLMLSLASGKQPDVAMAIANNSPVEFAIREAVTDLSQFPDFDEVSKWFYKEALTTYRYDGGVYAFPETMNFKVMFYRKDILSQYGIPIPDTREQLYSKTLPALYREGFSFCYPRDDSEFILQYGGSYYTDDGKRSALDSAEVYAAFKEETELYTQYAIPVTANFYNRFRTGEMPIGIGEFTMYLQLLSAAPEISGKWAIAPIPGMKKSDGEVDRSNAAYQCLSDVILSASKKQDQSWEFLKWWLSTDTQVSFATEVEAVLGEEARWNTSNVEAFKALPWKSDDLKVITQMLESDKEVPVVLGGYYTTRYLTNAWNKVVNNGAVLRDELENAVININKELRSKQEEYGVAD